MVLIKINSRIKIIQVFTFQHIPKYMFVYQIIVIAARADVEFDQRKKKGKQEP